jgi:uncharacterized membrane protein HdeD (DUF308 family)
MIVAENFVPPLPSLLQALARNWWLLLLRGLCAVVFGVLTFLWPAITLITLVLLLGAYTLADGIFSLAAAVMGGPAKSRWWLVVVGLLGIAAGIFIFLWPGVSALLLLIYVGAWSIATGVMQIIGAIALRKEIRDEWLLIAGGILSVLFGTFVIVAPGSGALALLYVIGTFAIAYGIILILFSLRLHRHRRQLHAVGRG